MPTSTPSTYHHFTRHSLITPNIEASYRDSYLRLKGNRRAGASARDRTGWLSTPSFEELVGHISCSKQDIIGQLCYKLDFANFWVHLPERALPQLFTFLGKGILPVPSKFTTLELSSPPKMRPKICKVEL